MGTATCDVDEAHVVHIANKTFTVLQLEKTRLSRGFYCRIWESRDVHNCGMFGHSTPVKELSFVNRPAAPTPEECWKIRTTNMYIPETPGEPHKILLWGKTNLLRWDDVGTRSLDNGEANCKGSRLTYKGHEYESISSVRELRIKIGDEVFQTLRSGNGDADAGRVLARMHGERLDTDMQSGSYVTEDTTYIWKPPPPRCELGVARASVSGVLAKVEKGEQVFMSSDGSNVRFVLGKTLSKCDRVVYTTNMDDIYLMDEDQEPIKREIKPSEVSIISYINNRDDFLYHHIKEHVEQEFRAVLRHQCLSQAEDAHSEFIRAVQQTGVQTFVGSNGTFATSSGEVVYRYSCAPVDVLGLDQDQCFTGLPVEVAAGGAGTTLYPPGTQLFMLPITRRLVKHAAPLACSTEAFTIKYQNQQGDWVGVYPELRMTSAPADLPAMRLGGKGVLPDSDLSQGGLYDDVTLKKMETFLQQGDLQHAIAGRIADQARLPSNIGHHLSPQDVFPSLQDTPFLAGLWDWTINLTDSFGHLVAVLIGLWTISQLLSAWAKWVYAAVVLRRVPGFRFWWTPCLDCVLARQVARVEAGLEDQGALLNQVEMQRKFIQDLEQKVEELSNKPGGSNASAQVDQPSGGQGLPPPPEQQRLLAEYPVL